MTQPTYNAVLALFKAMNAACVRLEKGSGTREDYDAAFAEYQAAALAYPNNLVLRGTRADGTPMGPEDCTICGCNRSACMNTDCRGDGPIPNTPWQQAHPEWKYEGPPLPTFGSFGDSLEELLKEDER